MAKAKTTASPQRELTPAPEAAKVNAVSVNVEQPRDPIEADALAVLETVKAAVIATPQDYEQAATARASLRARHEATEARRVELKAPFLEGGKKVDQWFKRALEVYAEAQSLITHKMRVYDDEQRRIAAEKAAAERKRLEEEARVKREQTQMAMQQIQGIQQQVIIATMGRQGVRKGGTLECIQQTLQETIDWKIDADNFYDYVESAQKAKDAAVSAIKNLEAQWHARAEAEAKAAAAEQSKEVAKVDAAEERRKAVEARKLQLKAEADAKAAREDAERMQREAAERQAALERQAASVTVEDTTVAVAGLQRVSQWGWKLVDKSKVNPAYLILDEKAINAVVKSQKARAAETVGGIEVFEDKTLRQTR